MASPYFPEDIGEEEPPHVERIVRARFSTQSYAVLTQMATALHVTASDVMREALGVYRWLARERGQGGRFLVQRGCEVTELTIPSLEGMDPLPPMEESEDGRAPASRPWVDGHLVDESSFGRRS
jgi:hypothetical protein